MIASKTWGVFTWIIVGFQIAAAIAQLARHNWLEAAGVLGFALALTCWRVEILQHERTKQLLDDANRKYVDLWANTVGGAS